MITFDIETEPLSDQALCLFCPMPDKSEFEVGEFDPTAVKLGNLKDPDKIKAKIEKARSDHEAAIKNADQRLVDAEGEAFRKFKSDAGLNAAYSRVLAIGIYSATKDTVVILSEDNNADEAEMIDQFWSICVRTVESGRPIVGVNSHDFDLPYLARRSWILGVPIPGRLLRNITSKWPEWDKAFVDLRRVWLLGGGYGTKSSFDCLGHAFGTGGKVVDGCEGARFYEVWKSDRAAAEAYLREDVKQPAEWAKKMGVWNV